MRIQVLVDRSEMLSEGGEWNLIHGRNSSLVSDFGIDLAMTCVVPEQQDTTIPPHWREAGYLIRPSSYKSAIAGRAMACRRCTYDARKGSPDAIICSGGLSWLSMRSLSHSHVPTVWDIHGAVREEIEEYPKRFSRRLLRLYARITERSASIASGVFAVTPELRDLVAPIYPRAEAFIVPCTTPHQLQQDQIPHHRANWRKHLGIPEEAWCLVHAGGIGSWQGTDTYFGQFPRLLQEFPNAWLLCLTAATEAAEALRTSLPQSARDRCIVGSVRREELCSALCAADIGLLLREPTVTNKVAFPNKIDDFLAAGLPIATTRGLPAAARLIETCAAQGIVVDGMDLSAVASYPSASHATDEFTREAIWRQAQQCRASFRYAETLKPFVEWVNSRRGERA